MRYVKGLSGDGIAAVTAARERGAFASIADLHRRTRLSQDDLVALAEAGALAVFAPERRRALWAVHGLSRRDRPEQLLLALDDPAPPPPLPRLSALEEINWDWRGSGHSTRGHLLEPLRGELRRRGWPDAAQVGAMRDGARVDYVGVVICRQRPATAKDVTFMTLEDETGFVNLVLWSSVYQRHKLLAKTVSLLGVSGTLQAEDGVVHLIVERLWEPRLRFKPVRETSRDFC